MTQQVVISGTGLWTPKHSITNEELIDSYNDYADKCNAENAEQIAAGEIVATGSYTHIRAHETARDHV